MADITATIIETNIAGEVVDGDTIEATVTETSITATLSPLTEVDPIFLAHDAFGITAGDITLLTDLSALALTDGNFIVADGANWVAEAGDTARTSLGVGTGDSPAFTGLTVGGVDIAVFIDQDVSSGSSPTLDGTNFTGIPDGALDENYVNHTLADAVNDFLVASGPDTFVIKTLAEAGAILEADIDHGNIQGLGDGSDHTFIDQSVISGSTPTFTGTNFTGIPDGALSTDYVEVAGDTMTGALVIDGSADVVQHTIQANATQTANILEIQKSDGTVYAGADERGVLFSDGGTGVTNVFIGFNAGNSAATGIRNVAIGEDAGERLTTGSNNFFLGRRAGLGMLTGDNNVYIGATAGQAGTAGVANLFLGAAAGFNTTASNNVFLGYLAGNKNTSGGNSVNIGRMAGSAILNNSNNVLIGKNAGTGVVGSSNSDNVNIGYFSGFSTSTGSNNIFLGSNSGYRQTALSNLLIVDNQLRADIATELTNSILYGVMAATPAAQTLRINAQLGVTGDVRPNTDDTYYLGLNDDDSPQAWKGVILKDTTDGKYYRIEVINGVVTATDLTD